MFGTSKGYGYLFCFFSFIILIITTQELICALISMDPDCQYNFSLNWSNFLFSYHINN